MTLGQLKALAKPFYDELNVRNPSWVRDELERYQVDVFQVTGNENPIWEYTEGGYYPWNPALTEDELNQKIANIGQLKAVFALRLDEFVWDPNLDADQNGLRDAWEREFKVNDPTGDGDGDQLTNAQEQEFGTDPTQILSLIHI